MSFRRIPKEIDPRRPQKRRREADDNAGTSPARSYGQYIEVSPEELAELERATDEVAREGGSEAAGDDSRSRSQRRQIDAREAFEEITDEVSREDSE